MEILPDVLSGWQRVCGVVWCNLVENDIAGDECGLLLLGLVFRCGVAARQVLKG